MSFVPIAILCYLLLFRIAELYLKASICPETQRNAVTGLLALQQRNPQDPILHEYWADILVSIDKKQSFRHYEACLSLTGDQGNGISCAQKLLALYRQNKDIRVESNIDVASIEQLVQATGK